MSTTDTPDAPNASNSPNKQTKSPKSKSKKSKKSKNQQFFVVPKKSKISKKEKVPPPKKTRILHIGYKVTLPFDSYNFARLFKIDEEELKYIKNPYFAVKFF